MLERIDKVIQDLPNHPQYNAEEWPWPLIRDLVRTLDKKDKRIAELDESLILAGQEIAIQQTELEALRGALREIVEFRARTEGEPIVESAPKGYYLDCTILMRDIATKALAPEPQERETICGTCKGTKKVKHFLCGCRVYRDRPCCAWHVKVNKIKVSLCPDCAEGEE